MVIFKNVKKYYDKIRLTSTSSKCGPICNNNEETVTQISSKHASFVIYSRRGIDIDPKIVSLYLEQLFTLSENHNSKYLQKCPSTTYNMRSSPKKVV